MYFLYSLVRIDSKKAMDKRPTSQLLATWLIHLVLLDLLTTTTKYAQLQAKVDMAESNREKIALLKWERKYQLCNNWRQITNLKNSILNSTKFKRFTLKSLIYNPTSKMHNNACKKTITNSLNKVIDLCIKLHEIFRDLIVVYRNHRVSHWRTAMSDITKEKERTDSIKTIRSL